MTDTVKNTDLQSLAISPEISDVVKSGQDAFKAITGQELNDNQQQISHNITKILDGCLPIFRKFCRFDLDNTLLGARDIFSGIAQFVRGIITQKPGAEEPITAQKTETQD